jgi:hypothetical protein
MFSSCSLQVASIIGLNFNPWSQGSSVTVVTSLRPGRPVFDSRQGSEEFFLFSTASRLALGSTRPRIKWVLVVVSLGIKRPRREADHSPPSIAEIKNVRSYSSIPQYVFMAWYVVSHRYNLNLTRTGNTIPKKKKRFDPRITKNL